MRGETKQAVQGLGRCYALGNLFKLFSLLTTNVRQSLPNAFLLSLTLIYIYISLLAWPLPFLLWLSRFPPRPSNLLAPIVKVMPLSPPLTHFSFYSTFFNDTFAWIFVRVIYFFITFIIVQGFNFRPKRIYSIDVKISIFFFIDKSFIKNLNILSSWYCYLIKSFVFTIDKIKS